MKALFLILLGIALTLRPASAEAEQKTAAVTSKTDAAKPSDTLKPQTVCPVMEGNPVDRSVFTIWKGDKTHGPKKVYFCCAGCIEPFNADPVKYLKVLEKLGQHAEDVVLTQEKKK
jgi:hypothetical protein